MPGGPPSELPRLGRFDVIVIGAGFAGLACATALAEAKSRVLVLEARPCLGGRATAFRDPQTGERIDNGQHVLAGCYDETRRFLRRIGTETSLHRPSALHVPMIDEDGRRTVLALPPLAPPLHLLAGVLAWDALTWRDRLSVLRIGPVLRNLSNGIACRVGDGETVRQWLDRHHQSPRLCRLLWEPLALAALNQSIDHAAAQPFLTVIGRMFGSRAEDASLLLPATLLDELYAEPARDFLVRRGSVVHTGVSSRVIVDGDRVTGASVRTTVARAQVVVSAVPWHAFSELFSRIPTPLEPLVAHARALESSPIVTVNLWLDREVMRDKMIGLPGRTFQWVFDKGRIVGNRVTHLSLVSSGARGIVTLPSRDLIATALGDVKTAFLEASRALVRRASVVRERHATFSLSPTMPPRPATESPLPGLLLAGDWIDTGLPATIESAVVSGHRAARIALQLLGQ